MKTSKTMNRDVKKSLLTIIKFGNRCHTLLLIKSYVLSTLLKILKRLKHKIFKDN